MNAEWKEIKKNDELIHQKIKTYSTKQKVNLAKNTLVFWPKQPNVNLSSNSNDIILDECVSSTSSATTAPNSVIINDEGNNSTTTKSKKIIEPEQVVHHHAIAAQQQTINNLNEINERLTSLLQLKQIGLLTNENEKQLNTLLKQKKLKTNKLKRLQNQARAQKRLKDKQKKKLRYN